MRRLYNYKNFLKEALSPSVFRRYVKNFNKERYSDIFKKYEGDRNHYRIYLPLIGDSSTEIESGVYKEVKDFLEENGYEVVDYYKGTCKASGAKNLSKIGKVLNRFTKDNEEVKKMLDRYNSDPERKSGKKEDLMVVISRHPYDIVGADTDRKWTNCMTLSVGNKRDKNVEEEFIKNQREIVKLKRKKSDIKLELEELYLDGNNNEERIKILEEDLYEIDESIGNIESELVELEEDLGHGANSHYLMYDVKEGSLSSYLVRKSDKNINDPLATLNIKPFINKDDDKDFILVADLRPYGEFPPAFKETVEKWLEEVNGDKYGHYCLNPKLYDDGKSEVSLPNLEDVKKIIKSDSDEYNFN